MPGLGIIANPHSNSNLRSPDELRRIAEKLGDRGTLAITQDLESLDRTLEEFKRQKIETIALNGGDGTISQAITRLIKLYKDDPLPNIAVLRGGTMNLVASQLGVRGRPSDIVERLVEAHQDRARLKVEKLSTLKVNDVYGFLYADQSSTSILEEFYRKKSGHIGAGVLSLRLIRSFLLRGPLIKKMIRPHHLKAEFSPLGKVHQPALGCFAGTITKFPMGLPFLPLAREKPGYFQTTVVTCRADQVLWYLPLIMLQQNEGLAYGKHSFCCQEAELEYEDSVHYTVDGEIYKNPKGKVSIEAGPEIPFLKI